MFNNKHIFGSKRLTYWNFFGVQIILMLELIIDFRTFCSSSVRFSFLKVWFNFSNFEHFEPRLSITYKYLKIIQWYKIVKYTVGA